MSSDAPPGASPAPAERAPWRLLELQRARVQDDRAASLALDLFDGAVLILNRQRQIVATSKRAAEALGLGEPMRLVGMRVGDALGCVHAGEAPGGCGTTPGCSGCGALLSILGTIETGAPSVQECLMTVQRGSETVSRELRVRTAPIRISEEDLTVFVFQDIGEEKRREVLERVFLHDLANIVAALRSWAHVAEHGDGSKGREAVARMAILTELMAEELSRQRTLLEAERGELLARPETVRPSGILERLAAPYATLDLVPGRRLVVAPPADDAPFVTDPALLLRVLTNMVKNGLEATASGGEVRVSYARPGGRPAFAVWNPAAMPREVASRVFTRSFSTKGESGRGIGTYGMRLFGERTLGGKVSFTSREGEGTTFTISLPPEGPPRR